jgi:hypothetical protein
MQGVVDCCHTYCYLLCVCAVWALLGLLWAPRCVSEIEGPVVCLCAVGVLDR